MDFNTRYYLLEKILENQAEDYIMCDTRGDLFSSVVMDLRSKKTKIL